MRSLPAADCFFLGTSFQLNYGVHLLPHPRGVPQEVKKFEAIVRRDELTALHTDVDGLRGELLRLEEEWKRAQVRQGWRVGVARGGGILVG